MANIYLLCNCRFALAKYAGIVERVENDQSEKNTKEKGELGKWGGKKTQSKRTGKMLFALGNRTGDRAVVT